MGCVASRISKEERVRICKERKSLMKQLLGLRKEFAEAQLAYIRALKNTGVTLRQFTESELLELEDTLFGSALPPSPPPPLPPSPPPPPTFSPDLRKIKDKQQAEVAHEEIIDIHEENDQTPPPPPVPSSSWDFWDPFDPPPHQDDRSETVEQVEEENWAETNTEFVEEDEGQAVAQANMNLVPEKLQKEHLIDDNSSLLSWHTKDTTDMAMVVSRGSKTLSGIVRELDDYFLKASGSGKDVAVIIDINMGDNFSYQSFKEIKRKRSNSAKVFSALTWSRSSKSPHSRRQVIFSDPAEPCKPGAHCITLEKLYAEEKKLYREVKEEEITKIELERKSSALQKQEGEDHDWTKTEKTRLSVESLQSEILSLQQSISESCSTILKLMDEELQPQLVALTSGLMHLWRTMYECHQVQNHISQQLNHLSDQQTVEPTTEYHQHAAAQLKTEITSWYASFCKVIKAQQDYVRALCRWIQLTHCLVDDGQRRGSSSVVRIICEEWLRALDKLPDKMASEAIKSFLSAIHSIVLQQEEEVNLQKRTAKLERRLQRELNSLAEMEMKFDGSLIADDVHSVPNAKHPLSIKRGKVEVLKKQADDEKAKYLNSVRVTQAMILNNLQTSLPNVFRALMGFSATYTQSIEDVLNVAVTMEHEDESPNPLQ